MHAGWGYHPGRGRGPDFISDLQPSASFQGRAELLRLCCPDALWDLQREDVAPVGEVLTLSFPPNSQSQESVLWYHLIN